jgi:uncharacterized protein (DUF1697 family)
MSVYISMLRGVNVSGQKKVSMDALRNCYESMGFREVRTYIQSGNVVFEHRNSEASDLTRKIERQIKDNFGFDVVVIIRTKEEIQAVIENNPFGALDATKVHVTFLSLPPASIPTTEIDAARGKGERLSISGNEVYLFCPNGYGKTKLSNSFFERKLEVSATTRNWRTVNALFALAGS